MELGDSDGGTALDAAADGGALVDSIFQSPLTRTAKVDLDELVKRPLTYETDVPNFSAIDTIAAERSRSRR